MFDPCRSRVLPRRFDSLFIYIRGDRFQDLFERFLRLTFKRADVAGSLQLDGLQSDASFGHGSYYYRVEVSWDSRPNDISEIAPLVARMERTAGSRGVLVSMSGFTQGVRDEVERRKSKHIIVLIDREEFVSALKGESRFETIIDRKVAQLYLRTDSRPNKSLQQTP